MSSKPNLAAPGPLQLAAASVSGRSRVQTAAGRYHRARGERRPGAVSDVI